MGLHKNEPASLLGLVGALMVHIGDIHLYYLYPTVLPFRFKPRPCYCQRDGLEHSYQYGNKDWFCMEWKCVGDSAGIQQCLYLIYSRNDYSLVARELAEALSHQLCQTSLASNVFDLRIGSILHLPVCNSQNATIHIFPVLIHGYLLSQDIAK